MNTRSSPLPGSISVVAIVWSLVALARSPHRYTVALDEALRMRVAEGEGSDATRELRALIASEVAGMKRSQSRLEAELVAASKHGWGIAFGTVDPSESRRVPWEMTVTIGGEVTHHPIDLSDRFFPRADEGVVTAWTANAGYVPTMVALAPRTDGVRRAFVGVRRVQFRAFPSSEGVWPAEITRGGLFEFDGTAIRRLGVSPFASVSELVGTPSAKAIEVVSYGPYFDVIRAEDEACFDSGSAAYLVRGPRVLASIDLEGRVVTNTERGRRFVARQCEAASGSSRKRGAWLSDVAFELACRRLLGEATGKLLDEIVEPELRRPRCVDASFLRAWAAMPTLSDG